MYKHKKICFLITVCTILLLFIQPVLAYTFVEEDGSAILAEASGETGEHDGSYVSGQGGKGQGGVSVSGDSGYGGGSGSGGYGGSGYGGGSGSDGSGVSGGSTGSGGGKPGETGGLKTLIVTVEWPDNVPDSIVVPNEVDVTLKSSDSSETQTTDENNSVTFLTEPGDEWVLIGESVPGFIIPEVGVAIKGTDEIVYATLEYVVGNTPVNNIVLSKTLLELLVGGQVTLDAKVYPTNANNKSLVWESSSPSIATVANGVVTAVAEGDATITAKSIDGSDVTAACVVTVKSLGVRVNGVTLNENSLNLDLGDNDTYQFVATVSPVDATVKDVLWSSSNENVATIDEFGNVTAKSTGFTVITVTTVDGGFTAYAQVSVGAALEIAYIFPCLEDNDAVEHFENPAEVFINVSNLIQKLIDDKVLNDVNDSVTYYVKVTEKGTTEPLGEGTVDITMNMNPPKFHLQAVTNFLETENYSERYYVYMSTYSDYPKDDEKTLSTNFMGESSTPTIPEDNVNVHLTMVGGDRSIEGIIFLLTREEFFDTTLEGVSWREFYDGTAPANPYPPNGEGGVDVDSFVDEVKMIGITNSEGDVEWIPPREPLKLGGYLLLEVTPMFYKDNLNLVNPASDDGDLLKQISLTRDTIIDVEVTNIYIGESKQGDIETPSTDENTNPPSNPSTSSSDSSDVVSSITSSMSSVSAIDLVKIEESEKYNGHWSKRYIDSLIIKEKMPKSLFDKITDLNKEVYLSDVVELVNFINGSQNDNSVLSEINLPITRQQAVVILMKSFGFEPVDNPELNFIDSDLIDENAKGYVAAAYKMSIISGYPDNSFKPNNTLSKAEMFTLVSNCLEANTSNK